ncbi:dynamin family protein [Streptomyces sp. LP11]|uniref:Dynamin family protein n=1 Tax=Streptomyces pyxinicus TaxID=2970331 RepID=A0ABT2B5A0_9ACTN|nr:dynamin family protein [Streptomyces sp. LP11]MCS0603701.1 dynamin family protein [Streptomyces sp. LP11]
MHTSPDLAQIHERLYRLTDAGAGDASDRRALDLVSGQLGRDGFRVLVAGEAKRGKSTLLNALLGRDLLPTGVVPVTALATTVRGGLPETVTVRYADGRVERHEPAALSRFVTQAANPGNRRDVDEVVLTLDAPLLSRGVELVDTPGTGSVHAQNTEEAVAGLRAMDACVFVLTADPPVSAAERELLRRVGQASVRTFVVLNKADQLDADELREAAGFTRRVVAEALGETVPVFECVAREGAHRDVDRLATALTGYLAEHRDTDLLRSLTARTRRLAVGLLDEVLMARAVADLDASRREQRVAALRAQLDALARRRQEAADLIRAEGRRALADVDEAARDAGPALTGAVRDAWSAVWDEESGGRPRREREAEGRRRLADLTRDAVDAWRLAREEELTDRLSALDRRVRDRLARDLDTFRDSVADLIGVGLASPADGGPLVPDPRFRYRFQEDVGQTELLAGWARRHLPGAAGVRRSRAHLTAEAADLVPMQIGRVRADFQSRLAESTRQMVTAVTDRYDAIGRRLGGALAKSAGPRRESAEHAGLADRERSLRQVVSELEPAPS